MANNSPKDKDAFRDGRGPGGISKMNARWDRIGKLRVREDDEKVAKRDLEPVDEPSDS